MSRNPRLSVRSISKSFRSTQALSQVSLDLCPGEVLALIGENGAGKSTLLKILSGAHQADEGALELDGAPYHPTSPIKARDAGVAMIYQELSLAPHLTALENIMLGCARSRWGVLNSKKEHQIARDALARTGHHGIDPDARVAALNPAERQIVEIARALAGDVRVLIMDEPTSSLTSEDTRNLFKTVRELKSQGVSILYVSHFLEEVAEVADRVTVLRDGRNAGGGLMSELSIPEIIHMMVGREIDELFPQIPHTAGGLLLDVRDMCGSKFPKNASLQIHRGEIIGIAGLVGAGRTEFLRGIFGLDAILSGEIKACLADGDHTIIHPKANRWSLGLGMVSEDRKNEGLATGLSIADNLCMTRLSPYSKHGFFMPWKRRAACDGWIERLGLVCRDSDQPVAALSGGNQQKVAFGRLLHHDADLLILDEPTRGIDVSSKANIYRMIGEAAAAGKAVLMVSSYLPELFGVCDKIAVMRKGMLSEARRVSEWTEQEVMSYAVSEAPTGAQPALDGRAP